MFEGNTWSTQTQAYNPEELNFLQILLSLTAKRVYSMDTLCKHTLKMTLEYV